MDRRKWRAFSPAKSKPDLFHQNGKGNHKPEGFSRSYLRDFQQVHVPLFVHQNISPTLG